MKKRIQKFKHILIFQEATPILIIVFAEVDMLWFFASKLQNRYPDAVVIGSSTYINYGIEVSAGAVFDVDRHPSMYKAHIKQALDKLSSLKIPAALKL